MNTKEYIKEHKKEIIKVGGTIVVIGGGVLLLKNSNIFKKKPKTMNGWVITEMITEKSPDKVTIWMFDPKNYKKNYKGVSIPAEDALEMADCLKDLANQILEKK